MIIKFGKNTKLSTQFAIMTVSLVCLIVLITAGYVILFTKDLANQISYQTTSANRALATVVFESIRKDIVFNEYPKITDKIRSMLTNKMIAYLIVTDDTKENVLYSTEPSLKGKNIAYAKAYLQNELTNNYDDQNTYFISGHIDNEYVYVGFYTNSYMQIFLERLINNVSFLVVFAILLSVILAYLMSKLVIRPIIDLIQSVQELGKGNLKHRVGKSSYNELNQLVSEFNSMAQSLQEVYNSLEQKVEERTLELQDAYKQLKDAQSLMVHSEKMRSLGELVARITHEINNPINFIYGNLIHLSNYTKDLISLIDLYIDNQEQLSDEAKQKLNSYKKEIDYEFLKDDLPSLIKSCQEGTERTKNIIADSKNFSRMEEMVVSSVDLEKEIDVTLNILHSKLKNRIEVHKEYEENLPRIDAFGGQLNQVFMNILDNAAFAIKEKGNIFIRIKQDEMKKNVIIEFNDDGSGMDEDTAKRIFDPFFTTKAPGQGTGLGMSISYKVIQRHDGEISVESKKGEGTTFIIKLPIVRENA